MPDTNPAKPITVRVSKAAALTGLSKWTLYKLCDEQKIESRYEGSARLIDYESLERYIKGLPTEREEPVA